MRQTDVRSCSYTVLRESAHGEKIVFMAAGDVAAFQKVAERKGCVRSTGQRSKLNVESMGGKK